MAKIRKLTGKAAAEYHDQLEASYVNSWVNPISYIFAEIRARILEFMKIELKHFDIRHRYTPQVRRLVDNLFLTSYNGTLTGFPAYQGSFVYKLRYKYLMFVYRKNFNQKVEWIRITSHKEKNQAFIWHEDAAEYYKQADASKK